jgi:aquaporin TIP
MGKLVAEFVGTFTLIFIGVGSIIADHTTGGAVGLTGIALAHGLAIACMVSATAHVSGAHLNPAVTVAALSVGRIKASEALKYIISQCAGAVAAAAAIKFVTPLDSVTATSLGTPMLGANISLMQGLVMETILTFFLAFVICGTGLDARAPRMGGLFIGLTVTLDVLAGGSITGAAMNPARSLGPALVGGHLENMWIYWVGPILGAVLAAMIYKGTMEAKAA